MMKELDNSHFFPEDDEVNWDDLEKGEDEHEDDYNDIPDLDLSELESNDIEELAFGGKKFDTKQTKYEDIRLERRIARLDITKNSEEDHRHLNRFTKKELEDQLKRDYKYMKGKGYFMVQPFLILDEYSFKLKENDSDVIREDGKNVEEDLVLVIGRLPKFKNTEEFKGKAYVRGEVMFVKPGKYDVGDLKPHFALVIKKKHKVIKQAKIRVRDLFDIIRNELQNGKPFVIYEEFPRLII